MLSPLAALPRGATTLRKRRWALALALLGAGGVLGISTRARAEDTPPTPTSPTPDDGKTEVHIIAPSTVSLEQRIDGDDWLEVCHAPCDVRLRVDAKYRTHGEGIKASEPFSLVSRDGGALIEVTPSSDSAHATALGLLVTGAILVPLGVVTVALGALTDKLGTFVLVAGSGFTAAVTGLVMLIIGGSLLEGRGPSKVTQPVGAAAASVRSPTWTTGLERAPSSATSLVVPIFSATF